LTNIHTDVLENGVWLGTSHVETVLRMFDTIKLFGMYAYRKLNKLVSTLNGNHSDYN